MKRRLIARSSATLSLIVCILGVLLPTATAAAANTTPGGGQALEIAPPIITLTVNPGQVVHTQIKLRDISATDLIVTNQVNDFVANGEDGTPKILLNNSEDANDPFSMKNWIVPVPSLTLKPQQIKTLNVTVNVPTNASPGGHYGVIRFTGIPPELHGQGVSLAASLGALMLITVNGHITHNLAVQEFSVNRDGHTGSFFESAPLNFVERLKNNGNVQEQPSGTVTVTDMFGRTTAGMPVNTPPHNVLPSSIRKFSQPMDSSVIGTKHLFGLYHAKLKLMYGSDKKVVTASLTFWVIPWRLIIIIVAVLIIAFFVLRWLIRGYNRRIISHAGGQVAKPSRSSKPKKKR